MGEAISWCATGEEERSFPYVSAAAVIAGQLPADRFTDKIVFVGATALGTQELVATPYDPLFAGVEVQATVADNLLRGDFIRRPEHALILEAFDRPRPRHRCRAGDRARQRSLGGLAAVASLLVLWGAMGSWLDARGVFLSPLLPTVGVIAEVAAVAFTTLTHEVRRRSLACSSRAAGAAAATY